MTQDDNASIERPAGGLSNYYFYTMSNDCAISRKKMTRSINSLTLLALIAESYKRKAYKNPHIGPSLRKTGSKLSRELSKACKNYPIREKNYWVRPVRYDWKGLTKKRKIE